MPTDHAALAASAADPASQPATLAATVSALNELALALRRAGEVDAARSTWAAALRLAPHHAVLNANLGALLQDLGLREAALHHYQLARSEAPDWAEVWNNSGVVMRQMGRSAQARAAFEQALRLAPTDVPARYNLGNALLDAGAKVQAAGQFRMVIERAPDHPEAHYGLGTCLSDPAQAIREFEKALALRPDFPEALVALACARLRACDWRDIDGLRTQVETLVRERPDAPVAPFSFVQLSSDPVLQRQCARNWTTHRVRRLASLPARAARTAANRLRVGYLSGDFRDHAVGHLICDLFAAHDHEAVEAFAYSSGPVDGGRVGRQVRDGAEHFTDVSALDDEALAGRIRADGIDILVDLGGYTEFSRSAVLSARPAPVQMSYLGYPGSMGSPFVDYVLADAYLVPCSVREHYDERVLELEACYQPSPEWIAGRRNEPADRLRHGLPAEGFVFASFNNPYKIRPEMFGAWMRILRAVPASVLWLPAFNVVACENLRRHARESGIDAHRLVFAPVAAFEEHSDRLPAADLFLDTHPYSAGATAGQTLAAGVPLLTLVGECYVSRMAGSVLHALGLDELIALDLDDYVSRAVRVACDRSQHARLQARLHGAAPAFFRPRRAAKALEEAYRSAWESHLACERGGCA